MRTMGKSFPNYLTGRNPGASALLKSRILIEKSTHPISSTWIGFLIIFRPDRLTQ